VVDGRHVLAWGLEINVSMGNSGYSSSPQSSWLVLQKLHSFKAASTIRACWCTWLHYVLKAGSALALAATVSAKCW